MKSTVIFYFAVAFSYNFVASYPYNSVEPQKYSRGYQTSPALEPSFQANVPQPYQYLNGPSGYHNMPAPTYPGKFPEQQHPINRENHFQRNQQRYLPEGPPKLPDILNSQYVNQQQVPVAYPHYQVNGNQPAEAQQDYRRPTQVVPQIVNTEPFIPSIPAVPLRLANERYLHASAPQVEEKIIPIIKSVPVPVQPQVLPSIEERYAARAINPVEQLPKRPLYSEPKLEHYLSNPRIKEVIANTKHQKRYLVIHPDGRVEHIDNLKTVAVTNPNYFLVHAGDIVANRQQHHQIENSKNTITDPNLPVPETPLLEKLSKPVNDKVQDSHSSPEAHIAQSPPTVAAKASPPAVLLAKNEEPAVAAATTKSQIKRSEIVIGKEVPVKTDGVHSVVKTEIQNPPHTVNGAPSNNAVASASVDTVSLHPNDNSPVSPQENKANNNNTPAESPVLVNPENDNSVPPKENQTSKRPAAVAVHKESHGKPVLPQENQQTASSIAVSASNPVSPEMEKPIPRLEHPTPESKIPDVVASVENQTPKSEIADKAVVENPSPKTNNPDVVAAAEVNTDAAPVSKNLEPNENPLAVEQIPVDPKNDSKLLPQDNTTPEKSLPPVVPNPENSPVKLQENSDTDKTDPRNTLNPPQTNQPDDAPDTESKEKPDKPQINQTAETNTPAVLSDANTPIPVSPQEIRTPETDEISVPPVTDDLGSNSLTPQQENTPQDHELAVAAEPVNPSEPSPNNQTPVDNSADVTPVREDRVKVTAVPNDIDQYILEEASISEPSDPSVKSKPRSDPVIWFRTTDPNFWDKLSDKDTGLDVVFFFQIHNQPKVEKDVKTTLYPNGTVVEDITETTWDFEGDTPKIIKTTKVTHPDDLL